VCFIDLYGLIKKFRVFSKPLLFDQTTCSCALKRYIYKNAFVYISGIVYIYIFF